MFSGLESINQVKINFSNSAHEKFDFWSGTKSDNCSRLFFKLKTVFLSRKDFFNSKGVGLGKESSNKNIDYSFEN